MSVLPAPSLPLARSLQSVALEDVPTLSAFQLFQHQLDSTSVEAAVDGMKRLGVVATAMGASETVSKLIPYLTNQVVAVKANPPYYADEVLLILGQELPTVLQVIGKKNYPETIPLLERLASVEETVVREQAVSVLQLMAPDMVNMMTPPAAGSSSQQSLLVSLVKRLGAADWFTAKVSACGILPFLFVSSANGSTLTPQQQLQQNQDLLHLYRELCHDDTPMVRRAAAKHLGKAVQAAGVAANASSSGSNAAANSQYVLEFLLQTLPTLMNDEQDSVRLLAAGAMADAAVFALQPQWTVTHILPLVKQASTDMSWRVRNNLAKNFSSVASNLGISNNARFAQEQSLVMACFVSLLTDAEAEVRASATSHLARMIAWGGPREFSLHLQPLLHALADDVVMEVRSKTALAIMEAAAASSPQAAAAAGGDVAVETSGGGGGSLEDAVIIQVFGPLLESFLGDEFHEVQLQVLTNLHKIAHLLPGLAPVVTSLLHMTKATNWRVREAVAKLLPHLATARGVDFFATVLLEPAWLALLLDPVAQVRYAICSGMQLLVQVAGPEWILTQLLPHHVRIYNSAGSSYLVRMTLVHAHVEMAMATTDNTLWCDAVLQLLRGLQDKVANVRMVSARGLGRVVYVAQNNSDADTVLSPQIQSMIASQIRPAMEKMREDEDWDCRQVCQQALDQMSAAV